MSRLLTYYDRIAVISLPERVDRRDRLMINLRACGLAEPCDITWVDAVDGRKENVPTWFQQGPGAWGCRLSQLKVVEQAKRDGLANVLILEDDAVFHRRAAEQLSLLQQRIPNDWEQFFLGGQHVREPRATSDPMIQVGAGITRTHAYAVHSRIFDSFLSIVSDDSFYQKNPRWHVDHHLAHLHEIGQWKVYCPTWWLAGQDDGASDICNGQLPVRWWQQGRYYWKLPIVLAPLALLQDASAMLHVSQEDPPVRAMDRAIWFRRLAMDAWEQGRLPSLCEDVLSASEIRKFWPSGSLSAHDLYQIEALCDYPANGLFPHPFFSPELVTA